MNRRKFVGLLTAAGAWLIAGGNALASKILHKPGQMVDAGPVGAYTADGVYQKFRSKGFFVIRRDGKLSALSSICPHRGCIVDAEKDHTFTCPCHGSTFDARGKVTEGPAKSDLAVLPTFTSEKHELFVKTGA
jgi:Rieske Fe-S protein